MANVYNDGFKLIRFTKWDFLLIVSADALLPANYFERLMFKVKKYHGVISGQSLSREKQSSPPGSGRIIRREIMEGLNMQYPVDYYWEEAVIYYSHYSFSAIHSYTMA